MQNSDMIMLHLELKQKDDLDKDHAHFIKPFLRYILKIFFLSAAFPFKLSFSSSCSPPFERVTAPHIDLSNFELCCKTPIAVFQTYIPEHQLALLSHLLKRKCVVFLLMEGRQSCMYLIIFIP